MVRTGDRGRQGSRTPVTTSGGGLSGRSNGRHAVILDAEISKCPGEAGHCGRRAPQRPGGCHSRWTSESPRPLGSHSLPTSESPSAPGIGPFSMPGWRFRRPASRNPSSSGVSEVGEEAPGSDPALRGGLRLRPCESFLLALPAPLPRPAAELPDLGVGVEVFHRPLVEAGEVVGRLRQAAAAAEDGLEHLELALALGAPVPLLAPLIRQPVEEPAEFRPARLDLPEPDLGALSAGCRGGAWEGPRGWLGGRWLSSLITKSIEETYFFFKQKYCAVWAQIAPISGSCSRSARATMSS